MQRICVFLAASLLCGCGVRHYPLVGGSDPTPPRVEPAPTTAIAEEKAPAPVVEAIPTATISDSKTAADPEPRPTLEKAIDSVNGLLEDVYYDYDHADLAPASLASLQHDADLLRAMLRDFPGVRVIVEGHCDERGSAEYNLGLGDRRAMSAIAFLVRMAIPAGTLAPISYGKERPQCVESSDACRRLNRRVHLVAGAPVTD